MDNAIMNGYQKRITGWPLALWSEPNLELSLPEISCSLMPKINALEQGAHKVRTETLDRLMASINPEKIDWLKIDVEGAEIEVLKGAQDTIEKYNPRILLEYHVDRNNDPEHAYINDQFELIRDIGEGHYVMRAYKDNCPSS
jgi:hypothetical protein